MKVFVMLHRNTDGTDIIGVYKTEDKAWTGAGKFIDENVGQEYLEEFYPGLSLETIAQRWGERGYDDEEFYIEEHEVK